LLYWIDLKLAGISALLIALTIAGILNISWPARQAPVQTHPQAQAQSILIESPMPY
jgi:hypothetical protein